MRFIKGHARILLVVYDEYSKRASRASTKREKDIRDRNFGKECVKDSWRKAK